MWPPGETADTQDAQTNQAGREAEPVQRTDVDRMQQGIGFAEWRKWPDVSVHQTIQCDMGIDTDGCAGTDLKWSQRFPAQEVGKIEWPSDKEECDCASSDSSGSCVGVKEPMKRVLTSEHVIEGLDIDQNVGCAEGKKAHTPGCDGVNGRPGTEVEWSDRHGSDGL